jgi:LmbE family N-acetylglucosaminyl deacetylase
MNNPSQPKNSSKNKKLLNGFDGLINSRRFGKNYALISLGVLLGTTFLWALLSAKLQQNNADQLINPYLLEHSATFRGAVFPADHTFLIKLPLFYLVKVFGYTTATYAGFTVATVLLTVGALAAILYKIEKRPVIFGTLCLALASVLLLVPAQPYAGGLLPVNMAMLTTRNLEYLFYIGALGLIIKSPKLRNWRFWAGIILMALLVASDKLFLLLALGGALAALIVYALRSRWDLVNLSVKSLVGSLTAAIGAIILLWAINLSRLTNISSSSGSSPYGLVHSAKNLALGITYAIAGLFTNFGANPAYDATTVRNIPHQTYSRLSSISGPAYLINAAIMLAGLLIVWRLVHDSLIVKRSKKNKLRGKAQLSLMLVWSTLAALGIFVLSDHYYAVDARYLTIALFAVFITAASFISQRFWQPKKVIVAGAIITLGILLGIVAVARNYESDNSALADIAERDQQVAQVLKNRPVDVLVGDYWRVVPTRLASGNKINILPLSDCTTERSVLSTSSWQLDLHKHSFAYLLTFDGSLTGFSKCSLKQVVASYGRPNASVLIAGSLSHPKEVVLLYDNGIQKSAPKTPQPVGGPATVLPITLDQLPNTVCAGPSSLNIVAHQDDDLLFMNPDIIHDIKDGRCVRTVYLTAGDNGAGQFYWLSREQGSEAAYSKMVGANPIWVQRIAKLSTNDYVTVANPRGNSKISLIFMHLPDGNINGTGFSASNYESLQKLGYGQIGVIHSVDRQSTYSSGQLTTALTDLMYAYQPTDIRTQANFVSKQYPDHSDHMAVGRYVKAAYAQYEKQQFDNQVTIPLRFYIGYPIHSMPPNVLDGDLQEKESVFLAYASFDDGVCQTLQRCEQNPAYGSYLHRQYQNSY